jgi:hypothetical protein
VDRVVVLLDADDDDPYLLVGEVVLAASSVAPGLGVLVRLAVEETEAFYLGDLAGLRRAFPDVDLTQVRKYEPDSICGTWEFFGKVVNDRGGNKVAWAEAMAPVLTTKASESRSPSFKGFVSGLLESVPKKRSTSRVRRRRHPPRDRRDPSRRR